jgi:sugar phosphate permease
MLATAVFVYLFWKVPAGHPHLDAVFLFLTGFCIYGPQFLVGVMTADIVGKRGAASAIGLTGLFGYASGVLSGVVLGKLADQSWDKAFGMLLLCSLLGAGFFALAAWGERKR